jgi:hypothetical protein
MRKHVGTQVLVAGLLSALAATGIAQEKPAGRPSEGIKVHGHWTIEIRNPDGSLVSRSEFENALLDTGKVWLARLLGSRTEAPRTWDIRLSSTDGLCEGHACEVFTSVDVPVTPEGVPIGNLEIKGTWTAPRNLVISGVETQPDGFRFSRRDLDSSEQKSIVTGQILQLTVVFSFS